MTLIALCYSLVSDLLRFSEREKHYRLKYKIMLANFNKAIFKNPFVSQTIS